MLQRTSPAPTAASIASLPPCDASRGIADADRGEAPAPFQWIYDLCPSCDTATGSRGCAECEGDGEVTAACCSCFNVYPLNGDRECEDCAASPLDMPVGWKVGL